MPVLPVTMLLVLTQSLFANSGHPKSVCEAVLLRSRGSDVVVVRGLAKSVRTEIVMFDYTCPQAKGKKEILPSMVLVEIERFENAEVESACRRAVTDAGAVGPYFQLLVKGRAQCRKVLLEFNDQGENIAGSGFGRLQLGGCMIRNAVAMNISILDEQ